MIHCSIFSNDCDDNYTLVSGTNEDVVIEFADLLLSYVVLKSSFESDELTTMFDELRSNTHDIEAQATLIHYISSKIFPIIKVMVDLGTIEGYIEEKQKAMGTISVNSQFMEFLRNMSNSGET